MGRSAVDLPDEAYLAGIVAIPGIGPAQQRDALAGVSPAEAWDRLRNHAGAPADLEHLWARHLDAGVTVLGRSHPDYPSLLRDDPEPPAVLFCRGDLGVLARRRVAVVGTRNASRYGVGIAEQLGARLGAAGVAVVSGLALGIDGAVHRGLLRVNGAPVGVVGCGLDVVYPSRHRALWHAVAEEGLLVSELALGMRPTRWSFPARNRIIAGLSEVVVVVESRQAGGSLYTAEEALTRDLPLLAVPGPITSPAAKGTNRLIADGATPMCAVDDIFLTLGLTSPVTGGTAPVAEPGGQAGRVLDACAHESVTLETLVVRSGLGLAEVATAIDELCRAGWLSEAAGRYERAVPR
jgi:DNA processing protein